MRWMGEMRWSSSHMRRQRFTLRQALRGGGEGERGKRGKARSKGGSSGSTGSRLHQERRRHCQRDALEKRVEALVLTTDSNRCDGVVKVVGKGQVRLEKHEQLDKHV